MTLQEIWGNRIDRRHVACLSGTLTYVSLGHDSVEAALKDSGISAEDAAASTWFVGEVISNEHGVVVSVEPR